MALKIWLAALMAMMLTALTHTARADEARMCLGDDCPKDTSAEKDKKPQNQDFMELGFKWDRQYILQADPQSFNKLRGDGYYFAGAYGWSTLRGKGMTAITLTLGGYSSKGQLKTGEELTNNTAIFAPGVLVGQYLGKRLFLTEGLSLITSEHGPGGQADLNATIILFSWVAVRFGINGGYYRTGLQVDGKSANMWALGPTLGFVVVPWGNYKGFPD